MEITLETNDPKAARKALAQAIKEEAKKQKADSQNSDIAHDKARILAHKIMMQADRQYGHMWIGIPGQSLFDTRVSCSIPECSLYHRWTVRHYGDGRCWHNHQHGYAHFPLPMADVILAAVSNAENANLDTVQIAA